MDVPPQQFPPIGELLKRQGIWLEKKKSQHFLRSQETCARIAALAELSPRHLAVEVGAGLGNLTVELAARAGRVLSVEMDRTFKEWHDYLKASYPSIEFVYTDFLKMNLEEAAAAWSGPVAGIGNLPYQITSEVLFRFVDSPATFDRLVFMVQKEVAERVAAGPASRASGALTYKIALRYSAEIALMVPAAAFLPPPKVESAVLVLTPLPEPLFANERERGRVYTLLDGIFRFRRKMLLNGLAMAGLVDDKQEAEYVLETARIDSRRRPETLELAEVLALANAITGKEPR